MKANHNCYNYENFLIYVVINISKIQNESKSQQVLMLCVCFVSCYQYFKDTK